MSTKENQPVLLFDGVCNLCNGAVQFIIERDSDKRFLFASLQSDYAQQHLKEAQLPEGFLDSLVLMDKGKYYTQSSAALRIAKQLDGAWPLMYGFIIVPKFIRDAVYNFIARNRYKWFGKKEQCWIPTPDLKARFVG